MLNIYLIQIECINDIHNKFIIISFLFLSYFTFQDKIIYISGKPEHYSGIITIIVDIIGPEFEMNTKRK